MNNRSIQLVLLICISLVAFTARNGVRVEDIVETRNLTSAREMLQKHKWFEPTMNGELRFEKPPLPTWITAATMHFVGEDNLSLLRWPAALAGLLLVIFTFLLAELLSENKQLPLLAGGIVATSFFVFTQSRNVGWDIFCNSFMIGAIYLIHKGFKKDGGAIAEFMGAGILMGLSFMSKGPVAFYALLFPYLIARFATIGCGGFKDKRLAIGIMILITIVLSGWWPLKIALTYPEISKIAAQKELSARLFQFNRPFYHYWNFFILSGVWSIMAFIALFYPYAKKRIEKYLPYKFLFVWIISAVILLSLIPEKVERFLLPVYIPLAILVAGYFQYLTQIFKQEGFSVLDTIALRFNALLMGTICFFTPFALLLFLKSELQPKGITLFLIFAFFWIIAFVFGLAYLRRNGYFLWSAMVGMVLSICILILPWAETVTFTNTEFRSYKLLKDKKELAAVPFYYDGILTKAIIIVVWHSGHEIKGWNPKVATNFPVALPILLLSNEEPSKSLPDSILNNYQIEVIGHFDQNRYPKLGHDKVLANYAILIDEKK